eukprot:5633119-Prymnesium_polylepis.2
MELHIAHLRASYLNVSVADEPNQCDRGCAAWQGQTGVHTGTPRRPGGLVANTDRAGGCRDVNRRGTVRGSLIRDEPRVPGRGGLTDCGLDTATPGRGVACERDAYRLGSY